MTECYKVVKASSTQEAIRNSGMTAGNIIKIEELLVNAVQLGHFMLGVRGFSTCTENELGWFELLERIAHMNTIMEIDVNNSLTDLGLERIKQLQAILIAEVNELEEIIEADPPLSEVDKFVALADLLGDLIVYSVSECARWGIPIGSVLTCIMDSQESKLENGRPVPGDMPGKFGKGRYYKKPEPAIQQLLFPEIAKAQDDGVSYSS